MGWRRCRQRARRRRPALLYSSTATAKVQHHERDPHFASELRPAPAGRARPNRMLPAARRCACGIGPIGSQAWARRPASLLFTFSRRRSASARFNIYLDIDKVHARRPRLMLDRSQNTTCTRFDTAWDTDTWDLALFFVSTQRARQVVGLALPMCALNLGQRQCLTFHCQIGAAPVLCAQQT